MAWEVFKRRVGAIGDQATITIDKNGQLRLSATAWELLDRAPTVDLLFSVEERIVGMRPSAADSAFRVTSGRAVASASFLRHFEITERSVRRAAYLDGDVLCIDLKQPGFGVLSNRSNPS